MKPSYRTTADDLVRTLRRLRLDVLQSVAATERSEREREPQHGKRTGEVAAIREGKHR